MICLIITVGLSVATFCDAEINDSEKLRANLGGSCEPNTYIYVDCNVCHCDSNGRIDTSHCTRRPCKSDKNKPYKAISDKYQSYKRKPDEYKPYKAISDKYQSYKGKPDEYKPYKARRMAVHSSCESGTWYSLAPGQFCYCVDNNKLVCSTGNSQKSQLLELGMYNMTVCGKHLIKDVLELIPEGQDALRQGSQIAQSQNNQQTNSDRAQAYVEPKREAPKTNYGAMAPVNVPTSQFQFNREASDERNKTSNDVSEYDSESNDIDSLETMLKQATSKPEKLVSSTQLPYEEDEEIGGETEEEKPKKTHKHKNKSKHHHLTSAKTNEESYRPEKNYDKSDTKDHKHANKPNEGDKASKIETDSSLLGATGMLRLKLPQVLDKLLQMSLRKSYNKDDDDAIEDLRSEEKNIDY